MPTGRRRVHGFSIGLGTRNGGFQPNRAARQRLNLYTVKACDVGMHDHCTA